jgi:hypothetical protein
LRLIGGFQSLEEVGANLTKDLFLFFGMIGEDGAEIASDLGEDDPPGAGPFGEDVGIEGTFELAIDETKAKEVDTLGRMVVVIVVTVFIVDMIAHR